MTLLNSGDTGPKFIYIQYSQTITSELLKIKMAILQSVSECQNDG